MRCPVCRAENDSGPQCRRCRADIGTLFALEDQRRRVLDVAYRCLYRGELRRTQSLVEGVQAFRDDVESRRLIACSALLRGHFAEAWRQFCNSAEGHLLESLDRTS